MQSLLGSRSVYASPALVTVYRTSLRWFSITGVGRSKLRT